MMKYLALATLVTVPLGAQESVQCASLHKKTTLEGKVHDGCKDPGIHIHGCYVEFIADGRRVYVQMNGRNPFTKDMDGKTAKVTGDYYPNYWTYLRNCNGGKPFFDGEPDSLLKAEKFEVLK